MTEGEQLGILLDKSDILHNQMNQLFSKQGLTTPDWSLHIMQQLLDKEYTKELTTPDLSLLSSADKEEWNRLYEQYKDISDKICKLINE